jgi:hypothetical protein
VLLNYPELHLLLLLLLLSLLLRLLCVIPYRPLTHVCLHLHLLLRLPLLHLLLLLPLLSLLLHLPLQRRQQLQSSPQ